MRKNLHDWSFRLKDGTQSKLYRTYGGCFKAALLTYGNHTDAEGEMLMDGQFYIARKSHPPTAYQIVTDIANMLDGTEWNADTCNDIANLLRDNGFTIGEPREED
jgi:hypothetical protein